MGYTSSWKRDESKSLLLNHTGGAQVLITSSAGWYSNCECTGSAFMGVFDDVGDDHKPALVFYNTPLTGTPKGIAEAVSHVVRGPFSAVNFVKRSSDSNTT